MYNDDPRRYPTSARRYVPGMYSSPTVAERDLTSAKTRPHHSQVDEVIDDLDTIETVQPVTIRRTSSRKPVGKGSTSMPVEYAYSPPQKPIRKTTAEDQAINMEAAKKLQYQITRRRLLRTAAGWIGAACVGGFAVQWGTASLKQLNETLQQGATAASSVTLVCGHQDSHLHPTELHAYLGNNAVFLLEIPGGNSSHVHLFQSKPLSSHFKPHELDHAYLQIIPEQVEAGKYQIRLILTGSATGPLAPIPAPAEWLLVDRGGHFEAVQPGAIS